MTSIPIILGIYLTTISISVLYSSFYSTQLQNLNISQVHFFL